VSNRFATRLHPAGRRLAPKDLAWRVLRHTLGGDDASCLGRLLGARNSVDHPSPDELLDELVGATALAEALDTHAHLGPRTLAALRGHDRLLAYLGLDGIGRGRAVLLYAVTRLLRPEVVVETGCFTGWDSSLLLHALERNGRGRLYSIDLPAEEGRFSQVAPGSGLPAGASTGFLIPVAYRRRWTLIEDDARTALPDLLASTGPIDLFYHDSDHSYGHMLWEFSTAWPHLTAGGVLVSDDISWNPALWDFSRAVGRRPVIHRATPNLGALPR
jgi:predicted O-methyltransferase YrrM